MDSEPSRVIDEAELRKHFLEKEFLSSARFRADIEEEADKTYTVNLKDKGGNTLAIVKLRRWRHGEVVLRYKLPFYSKFLLKQELTADEQRQYEAFQAEMVDMAVLNCAGTAFSLKYPTLVPTIYDTLCSISGLSQEFIDNLESFVKSDYGISYGLIWLNIFHKTPSEVAELPETDVMFVETLVPKLLERTKQNG